MPSMREFGVSGQRYTRLDTDVELISADSLVSTHCTDQSYPNGNTSNDFSDIGSTHVNSGTDGVFNPCQLAKRDGKRTTFILLFFSSFTLLFMMALSLGLGGYSVLIFKPAPFIDKSVDAFSIPNHSASRNFHALKQAQSRRYSAVEKGNRPKREADNNIVGHSESRIHASWLQVNSDIHVHVAGYQKRQKRHSPKFSQTDFRSNFYENTKSRDSHRARKRRSLYSIHSKLQVIFIATGKEEPGNMFTRERLETVHHVEQQIIQHPGYADYCWIDHTLVDRQGDTGATANRCAPLNSLMTYFYPSTAADGKIRYDGLGANIVDIKSALKKAMSHKEFYYFVDENMNGTGLKSRILRTEVLFRAPWKGYGSAEEHRAEQSEKLFKQFLISYIELLSAASTSKVQVLYGDNELFNYQVESTFWSDLWLARYALIFIWIFVFILTSFSIWLTFWGMMAIFLSFPLAFFFYRVAFNIQALGILNGAAAFIVIGIGVDDVFVFVNTFRQSQHMDHIKGRLLYTIKTAGKATFFTSFTTAAAFAANIASSIPALHEFGLFMALIVVCCWLSVALVLPPVLYLWHLVFAWMDGLLISLLKYMVVLRRDVDALQVSDGEQVSMPTGASQRTPPFDEEDVAMLQMDTEDPTGDPLEDDEPLLVLYMSSDDYTFGTRTPAKLRHDKQLFDLGHHLQKLLCNYIIGPVIRARWAVTAVYVLVLLISVGLISQIKLASKPPQLFKADTNLQMMLDLKANLSIDKVFCPRCSGIYSDLHDYPSAPVDVTANIPPKRKNFTLPNGPVPTIPPNFHSPPGSVPHGQHTHSPQQPDTPGQHNTLPPVDPHQSPHTGAPRKPNTPELHKPISQVVPSASTPLPKPDHELHGEPHTKAGSSTSKPATLPATASGDQHLPDQHNPATISPLDICKNGHCGKAEKRPVMESRAVVYVVFGISHLDRSNLTSDHVISDNYGKVVYDKRFPRDFTTSQVSALSLKELCKLCKLIASKSDLVVNGSAQCLPSTVDMYLGQYLEKYPECHNLPRNLFIYHRRAPAQADARPTADAKAIKWMAFAFESTTSKGQSYFHAYQEYLKWEEFMEEIKRTHLRPDSPLQSIFQTSEFWTKVLMEVVCVSSAIYGVVLSMFICVVAVAIFTGHIFLLLVVVLTIGGVISLVVALFFVAGWEMGAVEAVSLSILVGSSVDYCVHVVEGFILAGNSPHIHSVPSDREKRRLRVLGAVQHIGVSILSSALTTVVAAIPLTQTTIQPFARFGDIVAMNTSFSILYALTACTAFLAIFGPAKFRSSWKSTAIAVAITMACAGVSILVLFILTRAGVNIPSPNGGVLFPK